MRMQSGRKQRNEHRNGLERCHFASDSRAMASLGQRLMKTSWCWCFKGLGKCSKEPVRFEGWVPHTAKASLSAVIDQVKLKWNKQGWVYSGIVGRAESVPFDSENRLVTVDEENISLSKIMTFPFYKITCRFIIWYINIGGRYPKGSITSRG